MNHRTLVALAGLLAWWGIGQDVAQAQTWRLGTFGTSPTQRGSLLPTRPIIDPNMGMGLTTPMYTMRPDGSFQPTVIAPGADASQAVSQTGHPVTHFNYQRWFPLNYGTTSGNAITVGGITGIGGMVGQGTPALQTGTFYSNQFSTNQMNTLNAIQRGRTGSGR